VYDSARARVDTYWTCDYMCVYVCVYDRERARARGYILDVPRARGYILDVRLHIYIYICIHVECMLDVYMREIATTSYNILYAYV
jgi:hypothetical protein